MTPNPSPFNHVVAFEVSKARLVAHALPADTQCEIANTRSAARRLLQAEAKRNGKGGLGPLLVVCEATGGYERHVLEAAAALGLPCHRAHGARVRFFARYLGLAAKTDPIDARMLALYGLRTERLRLYAPPAPEEEALRALKDRREQVQQMLIAETNRLDHAHPGILAGLRAHIRSLQIALKALETGIAELVRATAELADKARLMQSVIGVGPVTATAFLAYLPELGSLTKGQAARLTGLAPINRDSGASSAPRRTEAGRTGLKRALYMAAGIAMRRNPALAAFAARLKSRGKPFKVVVTAVMRKLVVILNAILRDNQPCKHASA
jgi:transposase